MCRFKAVYVECISSLLSVNKLASSGYPQIPVAGRKAAKANKIV